MRRQGYNTPVLGHLSTEKAAIGLAFLQRHISFIILLLIFTGMVLVYSSLLPPFEGPDEPEHVAYVLHLRQTGHLPDFGADFDTPIRQAVGQAPLYYLTAAVISLPVDAAEIDGGDVAHNPWWPGISTDDPRDNRNFAMMNPDTHVLTSNQGDLVHFLRYTRLASLLYGWLMLTAMYWGGLALFDGHRGWAALSALLMATIPNVLQVFATTTNDAAAITFSSVILAAGLHLVGRWDDRRLLLLTGVLLGLGALTKTSVLATFPVVALAVLIGWYEASPRRIGALIIPGLLLLGPALLIAGWWYVRGWLMFDDPLGIEPHRAMPWGFDELQTLGSVDV